MLKNILKKIYSGYLKITGNGKRYWNWTYLIIYYQILRMIFGLSYELIYAFVFFCLLLRNSFEKMALVFLGNCIIAYMVTNQTEANHYLSFVYAFVFLSVIKNFYELIKNNELK